MWSLLFLFLLTLPPPLSHFYFPSSSFRFSHLLIFQFSLLLLIFIFPPPYFYFPTSSFFNFPSSSSFLFSLLLISIFPPPHFLIFPPPPHFYFRSFPPICIFPSPPLPPPPTGRRCLLVLIDHFIDTMEPRFYDVARGQQNHIVVNELPIYK